MTENPASQKYCWRPVRIRNWFQMNLNDIFSQSWIGIFGGKVGKEEKTSLCWISSVVLK